MFQSQPTKKPVFKPQSQKELKGAINTCLEPVLTVELAKSGRSKCRACYEPIPKDAPRVGMKSFIGGRVTQAWQTPGCFVKGLSFSLSPSNRGKCKYSGATFRKGQARLTMTSARTKVHVALQHACTVLKPVIDILAAPTCDVEVEVHTMSGYKELSPYDQNVVRTCFERVSLTAKAEQEVEFVAEEPPRDPFENIPEDKMVDLADESSQGSKESEEISWDHAQTTGDPVLPSPLTHASPAHTCIPCITLSTPLAHSPFSRTYPEL